MNVRGPRRRPGFTILEMAIASVLMVVVATLLAQAWSVFGRTALAARARARIAQEASLAIEAIARDVGRFARPADATEGTALTLWVDDGAGVRPIVYAADDSGHLIRTDGGLQEVVAALVADFQCRAATMPSESGDREASGVEVRLTFDHRSLDRDPGRTPRGRPIPTYTLFIEDDPS